MKASSQGMSGEPWRVCLAWVEECRAEGRDSLAEFRERMAEARAREEEFGRRFDAEYEEWRQNERQKEEQYEETMRGHAHAPVEAPPVSSVLKATFRQLARQYHPDHNPDQSARERDLWNEIQDAYREGDLGRMEALAALGKVERQESLEDERVSVLVGLVQEVKGSLRSLESEIRRARKSPAWKFSKKIKKSDEVTRWKRELQWSFEYALMDVCTALEDREALIAGWRSSPRKRLGGRRG